MHAREKQKASYALGMKIGGFSFAPSDLNLITALVVVGALTAPKLKRKFSR